MLDSETDPLIDKLFEFLEVFDLEASCLEQLRADVVRSALHVVSEAHLPIGVCLSISHLNLLSERAGSHLPQL